MQVLKSTIIGRMWTPAGSSVMVPATYTVPSDINLSANESFLIGQLSFRTDRNLNSSAVAGEVLPVQLKKGDKLFFYANTKREGHRDPDYSVSVLLPEAVSATVINNSTRAISAWREANSEPR